VNSKGYVLLHRPEHPSASKAGYVMEHRLAVEALLGRLLAADEVVHHRNHIRDDNRPENLEPMPKTQHDRLPKSRRVRHAART
jgi:hypothetical protein